MEKFKKVVSKRFRILASICGLSSSIITFIAFNTSSITTETNPIIPAFQIGIFLGLQLAILFKIQKLRSALKNDYALKVLYIEETDERKKMIEQKTSSIGFTVIMICIVLATVISGFYNSIVFLTLIITSFFILLVKVSLIVMINNRRT